MVFFLFLLSFVLLLSMPLLPCFSCHAAIKVIDNLLLFQSFWPVLSYLLLLRRRLLLTTATQIISHPTKKNSKKKYINTKFYVQFRHSIRFEWTHTHTHPQLPNGKSFIIYNLNVQFFCVGRLDYGDVEVKLLLKRMLSWYTIAVYCHWNNDHAAKQKD